MTALLWRRSNSEREELEPAESAAAPMWPVLAELEVYARTRRLFGWIAPEGERTSDWMNRGHEMELLAPVEVALDAERPVLAEPEGDVARERVACTDVLLAVPPALPAGRHLRLHRRILRIHFEMDDWELRGRIHVRPGAEVGDYLLRSSRVFVPITEVELVHTADPQFRRALPVVIVNSRHVSRLHLVEGSSPGRHPVKVAAEPSTLVPPTLDVDTAPDVDAIEPVPGAVHRALSELAALRRDELISARQFNAKRKEILARL
jgi:Family of unknown function (DUF6812)